MKKERMFENIETGNTLGHFQCSQDTPSYSTSSKLRDASAQSQNIPLQHSFSFNTQLKCSKATAATTISGSSCIKVVWSAQSSKAVCTRSPNSLAWTDLNASPNFQSKDSKFLPIPYPRCLDVLCHESHQLRLIVRDDNRCCSQAA